MNNALNLAEQIAERFDNDGSTFYDGNDVYIEDACRAARASFEQLDGTLCYRFADDSAILISGDAWDLESDTHYGVWRTEEEFGAVDVEMA